MWVWCVCHRGSRSTNTKTRYVSDRRAARGGYKQAKLRLFIKHFRSNGGETEWGGGGKGNDTNTPACLL